MKFWAFIQQTSFPTVKVDAVDGTLDLLFQRQPQDAEEDTSQQDIADYGWSS